MEQAQQAGVNYLGQVRLEPPDFADDEVVLNGTGPDGPVSVRARFLIDASGQRVFFVARWSSGSALAVVDSR